MPNRLRANPLIFPHWAVVSVMQFKNYPQEFIGILTNSIGWYGYSSCYFIFRVFNFGFIMEWDSYQDTESIFPDSLPGQEMEQLYRQLSELEQEMVQTVCDYQSLIKKVHPAQQTAAKNLLHYLALRSLDIRELQDELHIGLFFLH